MGKQVRVVTNEVGTREVWSLDVPVIGLNDVAEGIRVNVPTTVYEVSGDDTSGVAGLLFPSGEFIAKEVNRPTQKYWEFDETLKYEKVGAERNEAGLPRVQGNSWTEGEVIWNGHAAPVDHAITMKTDVYVEVEQKEKTNVDGETTLNPYVVSRIEEVTVNRREPDKNSITGDWITTGELWRSLERGTSMQGGPVPGRVHTS